MIKTSREFVFKNYAIFKRDVKYFQYDLDFNEAEGEVCLSSVIFSYAEVAQIKLQICMERDIRNIIYIMSYLSGMLNVTLIHCCTVPIEPH